MKTSPSNGADEDTDADDDVDVDSVSNLYSFCVERLMRTKSRSPHWGYCLHCRGSRLCRLDTPSSSTTRPCCYGRSRRGPRTWTSWTSRSGIRTASSLARVPIANGMPALVSLAVLALLMKVDQEGTMLTICPLEAVFLPDAEPLDRGFARIGRCTIAIFVQLCWTCRIMLLPVIASLGTACSFLSSTDAQNIVLNSVAIAFVFELDDLAYSSLVPRSLKKRFEASPPHAFSPLAKGNRQARLWVSRWCWAVWLCDVAFSEWYYVYFAMVDADTPIRFSVFQMVERNWSFTRISLLAAAQVHLVFLSGRLERGAARARLAFRTALMACSIILIGVLMFSLRAILLNGFLAHQTWSIYSYRPVFECGYDLVSSDQCNMMHWQGKPLFETLVQANKDMLAWMNVPSPLQFAWGAGEEQQPVSMRQALLYGNERS